jgi:hypothetical protein
MNKIENDYLKTDEVLNKFKNGKKMFNESSLFNIVVQQLIRNANPYDIIEELCQINTDMSKALEQQVLLK